MTSIQNYREALHNSASAYSAALAPKPALMPLQSYEINLRSDAPAKAVSANMASLTKLLQSKSHWDMGVKAGRRISIYVPGRGPTAITVAPRTRVDIDIKIKNALPRVVIKFNRPVRIIHPSNDAAACVVNLLCDYQLDSITIHPDHAVDLDGYLATGIPGVRRHWPKRVVEPGSGEQAPQKHSMIRLAVATAIAVMRNVPHAGIQAIAKNMASDAKRDDSGEILRMVESILPLLTPGTVRGDSILDANEKPLVVRCDRADVLIPPQKYRYHLNARLTPCRERVTVAIGEGTHLTADGLRLTMSGDIHYDGRNLTGRDVQAEINQLRLVTLVTNGTPNQVLFPVYIDTTRAGNTNTVARVATNFSFGEKMRVGGRVSFCLPAKIEDKERRVQSAPGTVILDDASMQLVLQGSAAMDNGLTDYDLKLRVRQLAARGRVETQSAFADAAMPWSIDGMRDGKPATLAAGAARGEATLAGLALAPSEDPMSIDIHVKTHQKSEGNAPVLVRDAGATVRTALPLRLGVPGKLHLQGPQGTLDIHSTACHVASKVALGSDATDPNNPEAPTDKVRATMDVRVQQFAGTIHTQALRFDAFHLPQRARWRLGTGHVATHGTQEPLGVLHAELVVPEGKEALWHCFGSGNFHLPAELDGCPQIPASLAAPSPAPAPVPVDARQRVAKLAPLAVLAQGGPVSVADLGADISCDDATFDVTPRRRHIHLPIVAEYAARVSGRWQAGIGLDTGRSDLWTTTPAPLLGQDSDSEASFTTAPESPVSEAGADA